jgi:hypothetical protein
MSLFGHCSLTITLWGYSVNCLVCRRSTTQGREVVVAEIGRGREGHEGGAAGDGQGREGERVSRLEHMVRGMKLETQAVVRSGTRGEP